MISSNQLYSTVSLEKLRNTTPRSMKPHFHSVLAHKRLSNGYLSLNRGLKV